MISVVIPSFNHRKFIKKAIYSVLNQSYDDLELIVIDDGSDDFSSELIQTISDRRLIFKSRENMGAHYTINEAISFATGDYLAILNSDDYFSPLRFEKMISAMEEDNSDLCTSWIELVDENGVVVGRKKGWFDCLPFWQDSHFDLADKQSNFIANLYASNFVSTTSNILMKRNVYEHLKGFKNLRFVHDWDFLLRAAREFKFSQIDDFLMSYRTHSSNTISSDFSWMMFEVCWVRAYFKKSILALLNSDRAIDSNSFAINDYDEIVELLIKDSLIDSKNDNAFFERLLDSEVLRKCYVEKIKQF